MDSHLDIKQDVPAGVDTHNDTKTNNSNFNMDIGDFATMPDMPLMPEEKTGRRLVQTKSTFEAPPELSPPPLKDENQSCMLINITHKGQRPRSKFPGFRILGAFPNPETVTAHVQQHFSGSECSLFMTPAHQLMSICVSTERQQELDYNQHHIDELVKMHNDAADRRDAEFKKNVEERKTGSVGQSTYAQQKKSVISETTEKQFDDSVTGLRKTGTLSATACIAKQNFAAIIALPDIRPSALSAEIEKEPLVAVLAVFATEEEASTYAKYTASKHYPKCMIDVVDMYAWCFPENVDNDKLKEVYASDQLNDIMRGRKEHNNVTERFTNWCAENKVEPDVTELGAELENPPSVSDQIASKSLGVNVE